MDKIISVDPYLIADVMASHGEEIARKVMKTMPPASNKDWYCGYRAGLLAISLHGRMTKKTWKKNHPGKYIYWDDHNILTQDDSTNLILHEPNGIEVFFKPSWKELCAQDWIVYYNYNKE